MYLQSTRILSKGNEHHRDGAIEHSGEQRCRDATDEQSQCTSHLQGFVDELISDEPKGMQ